MVLAIMILEKEDISKPNLTGMFVIQAGPGPKSVKAYLPTRKYYSKKLQALCLN